MRLIALLFALASVAGTVAAAPLDQADKASAAAEATVASPLHIYNVRLTDYRLDSPLPEDLSASEVVERLKQLSSAGEVNRVETLRLSALEGKVSFIEFSKTTPVVVGVSHGGLGREPVKSMENREVSTQLELLAKQDGDRIHVQVVYKVGRLEDDGTETSPPSISSFRVECTQLLEPGTPVLIGSSQGKGATYITLAIE